MQLYRIYGDIVQLLRYKITQTDTAVIDYCASDEERDAIIERLGGKPHTVEAIDQTGNEWIDGMEFTDAAKVPEVLEGGEEGQARRKCLSRLEEIDKEAGASRHVRDVSISAGVVLNAVRVLLSRFARELNIQLPQGFGSGCAVAADILALAPPVGAEPEEVEDFNVYKALLLVSHFDPAINPGLTKLSEAEYAAAPIRDQLKALEGEE
jgi:hypothetical protein